MTERTDVKLALSYLPGRLTWIVGLGTAVGYSNNALGGWLIAGLTGNGGLDVEAAAYVIAIETFVMGMVMLAASTLIDRLPRKQVMLFALAAAVATQAMTAFAHEYWLLLLARSLSGVAFGLLYSVAIANGAGAREPQKVFAGAAAIALVAGTGFNTVMGYGRVLGVPGLMLAEAVYCLALSLPLVFMTFPRTLAAASLDEPRVHEHRGRLLGIGVILIMALLTIGTSGVLLFTVKIAERVGIVSTALGPGLSLVSLVSATGGAMASALGKRFGNLLPLTIALVIIGISLLSFPMVTSSAAFWALETLIVTLFWFISPYIFGLAVEVDGTGRLATASGGMKTLIGAVGVAAGGVVAHRVGMTSVGVIGLCSCFVAALIAALVVRALDRAARVTLLAEASS